MHEGSQMHMIRRLVHLDTTKENDNGCGGVITGKNDDANRDDV